MFLCKYDCKGASISVNGFLFAHSLHMRTTDSHRLAVYKTSTAVDYVNYGPIRYVDRRTICTEIKAHSSVLYV